MNHFITFSTSITHCIVKICLKEVRDMYKILIIEDEYHIRNIIKEYFSLNHLEVIEACNGYEALNLMNESIEDRKSVV